MILDALEPLERASLTVHGRHSVGNVMVDFLVHDGAWFLHRVSSLPHPRFSAWGQAGRHALRGHGKELEMTSAKALNFDAATSGLADFVGPALLPDFPQKQPT